MINAVIYFRALNCQLNANYLPEKNVVSNMKPDLKFIRVCKSLYHYKLKRPLYGHFIRVSSIRAGMHSHLFPRDKKV